MFTNELPWTFDTENLLRDCLRELNSNRIHIKYYNSMDMFSVMNTYFDCISDPTFEFESYYILISYAQQIY